MEHILTLPHIIETIRCSSFLAVLFSATLAAAQQQPLTPVTPHPGDLPQIVAFDNDSLLGDHIHIFGDTPDLGKWGNSISSMVIVAGRWELFDEEKFQGAKVRVGARGRIST